MARVSTSPATGDRFRLLAYVCGADCVRRATEGREPAVTFTWIFQNRPKDCRYAVTSQWDIARHEHRYFVFDLFDVMVGPDSDVQAPRPRFTHSDLEAAIMATVLLYNDGSG